MVNLSTVGRIFYGTAIAVLGFVTIYTADLPYMLIPPNHSWIPGLTIVSFVSGALLIFTGVGIIIKWKAGPVSLLFGTILLLIFCFYFIPYQFICSPNYKQFGDWENAAKELALSGGAFAIAGSISKVRRSSITAYLQKLIPIGRFLFAATIISFGIDHFIFAKVAAPYVPSWIPWPVFWMYFTGTALLGSGLAIMLKIKSELAATSLGIMILTWFIILHIPRIIASPLSELGSEITSAFIALAYAGTAFVIAGYYKFSTNSR